MAKLSPFSAAASILGGEVQDDDVVKSINFSRRDGRIFPVAKTVPRRLRVAEEQHHFSSREGRLITDFGSGSSAKLVLQHMILNAGAGNNFRRSREGLVPI